MIKEKHTYNFFNLLYPLKQWIIFCFLLFMAVKPAVTTISQIIDSKYEFYDNFITENTEEEKEEISDDEKNRHSFNSITNTFPDMSLTYSGNNNYLLRFKPDIHLPPPEL